MDEKQPSPDRLIRIALALEPAITRASAAILAVYDRVDLGVQTKSDLSPVTDADLASHSILAGALAALTPSWPLVSEEDSESHEQPPHAETYWLLDPLDGTKEFIARTGEFSISLGLVSQHRAIFGLLYGPTEGWLYRGGLGIPAQRRQLKDATSPWESIAARSRPADGGVLVSSRRSNPRLEGERIHRHDLLGSALKFSRVAEGGADLYIRRGPTMEWDTCAGQAILEAAGGSVLTLDGQPLRYGKPERLNHGFIARGRPSETDEQAP